MEKKYKEQKECPNCKGQTHSFGPPLNRFASQQCVQCKSMFYRDKWFTWDEWEATFNMTCDEFQALFS